MSPLVKPLLASTAGVLLSVALGASLCWYAAAPVVDAAILAAKTHQEEKRVRGWDFWTLEMETLAAELKEERARLRALGDSLDQRAARVASEARELDKIRTEIETMRREVSIRVIEIAADEAKNIRGLAQTYSNLTPKAAVDIFKEMDDVTAVKILSLMKPEAVGPIFEEMTRAKDGVLSRRAAMLSEKLRLMKAARPDQT